MSSFSHADNQAKHHVKFHLVTFKGNTLPASAVITRPSKLRIWSEYLELGGIDLKISLRNPARLKAQRARCQTSQICAPQAQWAATKISKEAVNGELGLAQTKSPASKGLMGAVMGSKQITSSSPGAKI